MATVKYEESPDGQWRLKIKAFANNGFLGLGGAYGGEMESFRRRGSRWKKTKVSGLTLWVEYVATDGSVYENKHEKNDNEIEIADRDGFVWPGFRPNAILGVITRGSANLPGGQLLEIGPIETRTSGSIV